MTDTPDAETWQARLLAGDEAIRELARAHADADREKALTLALKDVSGRLTIAQAELASLRAANDNLQGRLWPAESRLAELLTFACERDEAARRAEASLARITENPVVRTLLRVRRSAHALRGSSRA